MSMEAFLCVLCPVWVCELKRGKCSLRAKSPVLRSLSRMEGRLLALPPIGCGPGVLLLLCVNQSCLQYSLLDSQSDKLLHLYCMLMPSETKRCIRSKVTTSHPTLRVPCWCRRAFLNFLGLSDTSAYFSRRKNIL